MFMNPALSIIGQPVTVNYHLIGMLLWTLDFLNSSVRVETGHLAAPIDVGRQA